MVLPQVLTTTEKDRKNLHPLHLPKREWVSLLLYFVADGREV